MPTLKTKLHYLVWRPAQRLSTATRYPLIVMLHGLGGEPRNFIDHGKMPQRFADAVAAGQMPPCIVVMVEGRNGYWSDWTDGAHPWATMVAERFLMDVRRKLPVTRDPAKTVLMGPSMGGFGALSIGLQRADLFGLVVALSPTDMQFAAEGSPRRKVYTDVFGKPIDMKAVKRVNPYHLVAAGKGKGQRFWISWGTREGRKFKAGSERLVKAMKRRKLAVQSQPVAGGKHGWASTWEKSHPWWIKGLGAVWRGK